MKKRISDFLLDVSKYVFAGLLIAPLFTSSFKVTQSSTEGFTEQVSSP